MQQFSLQPFDCCKQCQSAKASRTSTDSTSCVRSYVSEGIQGQLVEWFVGSSREELCFTGVGKHCNGHGGLSLDAAVESGAFSWQLSS